MKQTKLENLTTQTQAFCEKTSHESVFIFDDEPEALLHELLLGAYEDPANKKMYLKLIEQIRVLCDCSPSLLSAMLGTMGIDEYRKHSPALAETIFRLALEISPDEAIQNNLAYVCRRHRDTLNSSDVEILDLLLNGIRIGDTFALINMALHFAFALGRQDDWQLADQMFRVIQTDSSSFDSAKEWWGDLANEQDEEGILVLRWLDRHEKIAFPEHLKESDIRLRQQRRDIPDWVFEKAQ